MRKIFTLLFVFYTITDCLSQTFPVDTLVKSGPVDNRINVVILGDGFTQGELPKFKAEAQKFAEFFLGYTPYNHYRNYFNFYAISTPSQESGVTNPGTAPDAYPDQPAGTKNTFYKATFGSSIHRLVTVDYGVAFQVLANNFPSYDLVVVLVNTTFYGGSGGTFAVHTLNEAANTIGVHEIGHTFGALNDEYWAGPQYGWEAPNMTANNNPATVKWKNWLDLPSIDIFRHEPSGAGASWYKPSNSTCLMQYLSEQFCAVCKETTTERILSLVQPIEGVVPDTAAVIDVARPTKFSINLLQPDPNTYQLEWRLNGEVVGRGSSDLTLQPEQINGESTLTVSAFDSTAMSRKDDARTLRTWTVSWDVKSSASPVFALKASADIICAGTEVKLTASGCRVPVTWSTGASGGSIVVSLTQTTTYSATCNAAGAPAQTLSATIQVRPLPTVAASNTGPYLEGQTITLNATGGAKYEWTGPRNFTASSATATIADAETNHAGVYNVKVTDASGCVNTGSTEVVVDPILAAGDQGPGWVLLSPNPASRYVRVTSNLKGESMLVVFSAEGRRMLQGSFVKEGEFGLNLSAGLYFYRVTNAGAEFSGKLLVR